VSRGNFACASSAARKRDLSRPVGQKLGNRAPCNRSKKCEKCLEERHLKKTGPAVLRAVRNLACHAPPSSIASQKPYLFPSYAVASMSRQEPVPIPMFENTKHQAKLDYANCITLGLQQLCVRPNKSSILPDTTRPRHKTRRECVNVQKTIDAGLWSILMKSVQI